jgi:hypothetical protein
MRSAFSLLRFRFAFSEIRREAMETIPGLLMAQFLIEDSHTFYTLSIWADETAIVDFGNVLSHIKAANSTFQSLDRTSAGRPELWSVQWRLWATSTNLNWEGLDIRKVLSGHCNGTDQILAQGCPNAKPS